MSSDLDETDDSSDLLVSLVLEIDAALHERRPPRITDVELNQLSATERQHLQATRQQLELLYGSQASTLWQSTAAGPVEGVASPRYSAAEPALHLPGLALFGIHEARFGRFEILRALGMGGHGVVFLSRDPLLDRLVALKLPRPDVLVDISMMKRFVTEGRAAALLAHPNIVTVLEAGETGGISYLAQDYISGPSLSTWLKEHSEPMPPSEAARILLQLSDAVATAHRHQIFHRDIKPGNVLLAPLPSAGPQGQISDFVPKLTDFGMAKLRSGGDQTQTGTMLGTPAYMSPEQAAGRKELIDATSDIYSLGAVLYELCTHQPLYRGDNTLDIVHQVQHSQPPRPRALFPNLPADLEAICLKCLRREQEERYLSAAELSDDLRRFLEGRPVVARPLSALAATVKWARRNAALAWLGGLTSLIVLTALAVSLWYNARLNDTLNTIRGHEQSLQERTTALQRRVYADDMRRAAEACQSGRAVEARQRLETWRPKPGETDFRTFAWWMIWHQLEDGSRVIGEFSPGATGAAIAVIPQLKAVATGEPDGVIRIRSIETGTLLGELRGHADGAINSLHLVATGEYQLLVSGADDSTVRVWDVATFQEQQVLHGHRGDVMAVHFLGSRGEFIASGGADQEIRIWDRRSGELLTKLAGHTNTVRALVEQQATGTLFSASLDGTVRAWDWQNSKPDPRFKSLGLPVPKHAEAARALVFNHDQALLTAGFQAGYVTTWWVEPNHTSLGLVRQESQMPSGVRALAWRDESHLVIGLNDARMLQLSFERRGVERDGAFPGHDGPLLGLDVFSNADRPSILSISKDGSIRHWPSAAIDGPILIPDMSRAVSSPIWHKSTLLAGMHGHGFAYEMPEGRFITQCDLPDWPESAWSVFSHDGTRVMTTSGSGGKYEFVSKHLLENYVDWRCPVGELIPVGALSHDGRLVYLSVDDGQIWAVDTKSGQPMFIIRHPVRVTSLSSAPLDDVLVTGGLDGKCRLWNGTNGQQMHEHSAHHHALTNIAWSRDGSQIATFGEDFMLRVWRTADWMEVTSFGTDSALNTLGFIDDGRTVVLHFNDQLLFWSVSDRVEVLRWTLNKPFQKMSISPDETMIALQDWRFVYLLRGPISHVSKSVPSIP